VDSTNLLALLLTCAPLVHPGTAQALIQVESSFNPYAIGVVAGRLERQPRTLAEGLATVRQLHKDGWNFSVGLAQINRRNFDRLGLTLETALAPCENLRAMQAVLIECFERASRSADDEQTRLRRALSCYYSGNLVTGFQHGYVQRVVRALPVSSRN
jgi:type IV secretion system protein VirB1